MTFILLEDNQKFILNARLKKLKSQGQRRFYIPLLTDQTIENMHSGITLLLKRRGGVYYLSVN